jgi:outer membrane protein TolC
MRWKSSMGILALLLAATVGCKQRVFMTEQQMDTYSLMVPSNLATNPNAGCEPTIPLVDAPPTLYNLERFRIRYLALAEAIAIALEQGTVGQPSLLFPGIGLDNEVTFTGQGVAGSDSIRVLALDPATVGAGIEAALSKFDVQWISSMTWTTTDQPIGTSLQTFQAGTSAAAPSAINQEQATLSSGLVKFLPTGGVAGITFNLPYTFTNLPARVNPAYQPQLQFQFEQPLLQGFGVDINQIRPNHPGSILSPQFNNPSPTPEGILITRIRFDQQRAEFERNVNQMLLNVETAYWNLYGSYWALYSREQGLRFAYESWKIVREQYRAGKASLADFAQAQGQYELFRAQRLQAMDTVLDNERQLRALMGMHISDGTRLVPADAPTLALYRPDWRTALDESYKHRPELWMAREDIKSRQLNVILAKNQLLPDLRVTATYDSNSIGSRLDGAGQDNALRNLASNTFNDWAIGLRLNVPIGFRQAHTQLRQAQLQLARSYLVLQDQELKTERFLGLQYRRMSSAYEQVKANRAQREAFAQQLRTRYEQYQAGRGTLDILLEAQRFWADALSQEYAAIVTYNNALVGFEFGKGTILQFDNAQIAEGPPPACVQARAVEHYRERTKALILHQRAAPTGVLKEPLEPAGPINRFPQLPPQSIPEAWQDKPPLKEVEPLPLPDSAPASGDQIRGPVEAKPEELLPDDVPPPKLPDSTGAQPSAPATLPVSRKAHHKPAADFGSERPDASAPVQGVPGTMVPLPPEPSTGTHHKPSADFGSQRPDGPAPNQGVPGTMLPLPPEPSSSR